MPKSIIHSDLISSINPAEIPKKDQENLLYYILMAFIALGLILGIIFMEGMVRFTLAILILLLIGFNLVIWSISRTEYSTIWSREKEFDEEVNLKLKETSDIVKRAFRGMELSQGLLEKRIRNLYLDKMMEGRNLSQEEVKELLKEPEEFRRMVDDDMISDFIFSRKDEIGSVDDRENIEDETPSSKGFEGEDYDERISRLLKRIERWE
ncbi:MAG: hypothetical protein V5A66_02775 [Candidatus Thermoplasmatota archaeon]